MRAAHDEAVGWKREAEAIAQEYIGNGYEVSQER
jgi:hypothetical protein